MTDALALAVRRARYGKDAPRQEPPQQPSLTAETVSQSPPRSELNATVRNRQPIEAVQHFVAAVYGIDVAELIGKRRTHEFILPRQVAMFICSELLQATSAEIGRRFNRDHSTVLHAIGRIEEMRQLDPQFGREVEQLIDDLRAVKPRRIMSEQSYSIEEKLAEVLRELEHRREVYPTRVQTKVMRQEEADRRIAILEAIAEEYREVAEDYREVEAMGNDLDD